ncbi:MAG: hypothetical protein ACWGOX_06110 [Desulforhopalus sp.]
MIELLVVKSGEHYYRFTAAGHVPCGLDKASVYPLHRADEARLLCKQLQETGAKAKLMKLAISEIPFNE